MKLECDSFFNDGCPAETLRSLLAGPTSQFLNGKLNFLELVLARMSLLVDQSCSVLPLRSAKALKFGELWREKCTRVPWTIPFKLARTSSFGPVRMEKWKAILES